MEAATGGITREELQLAARNHGMPLELLREPLTPVGAHYLLIHFDIPAVDAESWRLSLEGLVESPLELTLDDLRTRPARTLEVTLECAGNGRVLLPQHEPSQPWLAEAVGNAEWTGTPLAPLLDEAGVLPHAREIVFTGLDRGVQGDVEHDYERSVPLAEALTGDLLLAYELNGRPLPPQHGFPLRLLVPGWYGMTHVKWLRSITAVAEPFRGWQQEEAYRIDGEPVTRILPRALMAPPGIPEFLTRTRRLAPGPTRLEGRAWSGWGPIARVEVGIDGTWHDAELEPRRSAHGWHGWTTTWNATPGEHELRCRATDTAGNTQPDEPTWNAGGYCNNAAQRLTVHVA